MTYEGYEYEDRHVAFDGVSVIHDSGSAIKCQFPGDSEPVWVPLSQIHDDSEVGKQGDDGTLIVSRWFAEQAELV